MSIKTKLDTQDEETAKVDIPLFATVDDAVKDIKVDDTTVVKINIQKEEQK